MTTERTSARALATALLTIALLGALAFGPTALATAAPNIAIEQPLTGSVSNNDLPAFSGSSEDELDTVTVKVYAGSSVEGEPVVTLVATLPPFLGKWEVADETPLEPGVYTAVAEQEAEGEGVLSAPVTFTVDTTAPSVSIDPVTSPTADPTPALTGGAGTEAGDSAVAVTIYKGAAAEGEIASTGGAATEGATWTYTPSHLADGTYTAQATQHDEAGNTGTSTAVTFTVDTTAPKVSLDPAESPTNDATPTLSGELGTESGDEPATVTIYKGVTASGEIASLGEAIGEGATWSYTPTHLADGVYTARVVQADEAGNSATSSTTTFTVDTEAPVITITTPTEGAVLNVSSVTLSGLAGKAVGDHPSVRLKIYSGGSTSGTLVETLETSVSAGKWTTGSSSPSLANGLYTVLAEQSDEAGNLGTRTDTFTIKTSSPSVTLDTSGFTKRGGVNFTDATPSFSGSASTAPEDSETVLVKIFSGSLPSGSPIATLQGTLTGPQWSAGPPPAALVNSATYTAQATQEDEAKHIGKSAPATFTVDASAPAVTLADASTTSSSSQQLAGIAGTATGDSATVTVQLYAGSNATGSPLEAVSVQASAGAWSAAVGGLEPGTYTARAEQRDDVGNVGLSAPATFTVTKPEPPPSVPPQGATPVVPPATPPASNPVVTGPSLMQPFPVVRIAGSVSSLGVRLNLLTVQAPLGVSVTVSCHGRGCPAKRVDTVSTSGRGTSTLGLVTIRFRRFERSLRAGASLQIRASKAGQIGKYTRFTVRRGKLPRRTDTCLSPAGILPIACPS